MRFAFIGHSYHQQTKSCDFFVDILRQLGEVDLFFDESWLGRVSPWIADFRVESYDCVVIFQIPDAIGYIPKHFTNIVFIPMYDQHMVNGRFCWFEDLNRARTLCFSSTLHSRASEYGARAAWFRYFPDPSPFPQANHYDTLRAFFWKRIREIDEHLVAALIGNAVVDRFTLHAAPDPGSNAEPLSESPVRARCITRTSWFPSESDYLRTVADHNIFFAARLWEGIGLSFLKAMSMGLCVVAPDTPTHNEYIANGTNGLLYDPVNPSPVPFTRLREIGARARESAFRGWERWNAQRDELVNFILTPTEQLAAGEGRLFSRWWTLGAAARSGSSNPAVSVVLIGEHAGDAIDDSARSALQQDVGVIECLVVDVAEGSGPAAKSPGQRTLHFPGARVPDAVNRAATEARGDWVLILRTGERLVSADALSRLLRGAPSDAVAVYGHSIRTHGERPETVHRAADLATLREILKRRPVDAAWFESFPDLPAIAFRAEPLRALRFRASFGEAAPQEFLLRASGSNRVWNSDEIIAALPAVPPAYRGGLALLLPWVRIALRHGHLLAAFRIFRPHGPVMGPFTLRLKARAARVLHRPSTAGGV